MKPPLHTDLMQQFDPAMLGSIEHAYSKANAKTKRNKEKCDRLRGTTIKRRHPHPTRIVNPCWPMAAVDGQGKDSKNRTTMDCSNSASLFPTFPGSGVQEGDSWTSLMVIGNESKASSLVEGRKCVYIWVLTVIKVSRGATLNSISVYRWSSRGSSRIYRYHTRIQ